MIRLLTNLTKGQLYKLFDVSNHIKTLKVVTNMRDKRLLLLSSSNVHGYEYMKYAVDDIQEFLQKSHVQTVLFIPYASFDYDAYYKKVGPVFRNLGFQCDSIHRCGDPREAVKKAEAIFVGGGNTFLLLKTLYETNIVETIRQRVLEDGIPYIGSSAGTNVATVNICTTNDMPIVYPPTFDALNLVSFNINPHYYVETDEIKGNSTHRGETRDERIFQYLELANVPPVLGMKEGCTLSVEGDIYLIKGVNNAVFFQPGLKPREVGLGTNIFDFFKQSVTVCSAKA